MFSFSDKVSQNDKNDYIPNNFFFICINVFIHCYMYGKKYKYHISNAFVMLKQVSTEAT